MNQSVFLCVFLCVFLQVPWSLWLHEQSHRAAALAFGAYTASIKRISWLRWATIVVWQDPHKMKSTQNLDEKQTQIRKFPWHVFCFYAAGPTSNAIFFGVLWGLAFALSPSSSSGTLEMLGMLEMLERLGINAAPVWLALAAIPHGALCMQALLGSDGDLRQMYRLYRQHRRQRA